MTSEFVREFSGALDELTIIGRVTLILSVAVIACVIFVIGKSVCDDWCD